MKQEKRVHSTFIITMNTKEMQHFKEILLQLQEELTKARDGSQESTQAVKLDQTSVGRLSRMDAMQSQAMALESRRRREIQLTRIKAALARIDEEEYGYCAMCDEDIDQRRLKIDPANPFCVTCASKV